jgi:sec-independent protein translocase protein TatC
VTQALRRFTLRLRRRRNPEGRMSVINHLRELRRRLILAVIFIALGAILGWVLYPHVLNVLRHPYCSVPKKYRYTPAGTEDCVLIYHGVLDGFTTRLQVSAITGAVFTAPLWLYQIWAFITPGLRKNERKYTIIFILASTVLFAAGTSLAYIVLSKGLRILLQQAGFGTQAQLTVSQYIGFVTLMLVAFGAAFELPLIVVLANVAGVLPTRVLRKSQRLAIFLIFLFAAIATPTTDPITMCAMAVPMVLLFEGAVLFAVLRERRRARRAAQAPPSDVSGDETPSAVDPIPTAIDGGWDQTT